MICAACGATTDTTPCAMCGEEPILDGRFRLQTVLGRGRSGVTYAGEDVQNGRVVAVKEMPVRSLDQKGRAMVEREARVLGELSHPNIPAFIALLRTGKGKTAALCLVQERIVGKDLAAEALTHRYTEGEVLDVLLGVLPTLVYLHGLSPPVIHRDIKPKNLMRTDDGRLVVLDFGAVRDVLADEAGGSTVAGTFGYMAPEQFRGEAVPATDIYGLAATAVALLTRREPHTLADPTGVLVWAPHARVSPETAALLGSMLERDHQRRPGDARALISQVQRAKDQGRGVPVSMVPKPGAPVPVIPERLAEPLPAPDLSKPPPELPSRRLELDVERLSSNARRDPWLGIGLLSSSVLVAIAGFGLVGVAAWSGQERASAPVIASCVPTSGRTPATGRTVSQFKFIGGSASGDRVALAVHRPSDKRAQVILYEAGSRTQEELTVVPDDVPKGFDDFLDLAYTRASHAFSLSGMVAGRAPKPVEWCQAGSGVRIAQEQWEFRATTETCALGLGSNASFELCPVGESAFSCIRPPQVAGVCWDEPVRLVDIYELGDARWVVAERNHAGTTPRFAAGVLRGE